MTPVQANEFFDYLQNQLTVNGFDGVVLTARARTFSMMAQREDVNLSIEALQLLLFIDNTKELVTNLSNAGYARLVDEFRELLDNGQQFEGFEVSTDGSAEALVDLSYLPDYSNIIEVLDEIRIEIKKTSPITSQKDYRYFGLLPDKVKKIYDQ